MTYPSGEGSGFGQQPPAGQAVCSWHPDRPTNIRCSRCGRPACPDCLTNASVGQQCRQCVADGRAGVPTQRTVSGAPIGVPPLVATVLIAINLIVYIVTVIQAKSTENLDSSSVFSHGALIPVDVGQGQYWRVITNGFLHLSVIHIAANMLSLYFLGPPLERLIGRWRFAVVYLVSLLGGSASVLLFSAPVSMTAGASGAIFGLMGALVVTFKRMRYDLRQLVFVLAINLFISFQVTGISWQGHLGGLITGALIGAAMVLPAPARRLQIQIGASIALVVVCAAVIGIKAAALPDQSCFFDQNGGQGPGIYCTQ
ncbi:MAG: rhomboid family intramembrane serine protease [Actinomycetota bacterium]|nr:rhomboid family intramembrane serine protease [Actinomycetota bacterium]